MPSVTNPKVNPGNFKPGNPGRKAGTPNKLTSTVKMLVMGALEAKGGQAWLEKQMEKHPVAFMALLSRIIPTQIIGDLSYRYVARIPPPEKDSQAWLKHYAPQPTQQLPPPTKH
jgi:hypothetical protein